ERVVELSNNPAPSAEVMGRFYPEYSGPVSGSRAPSDASSDLYEELIRALERPQGPRSAGILIADASGQLPTLPVTPAAPDPIDDRNHANGFDQQDDAYLREREQQAREDFRRRELIEQEAAHQQELQARQAEQDFTTALGILTGGL